VRRIDDDGNRARRERTRALVRFALLPAACLGCDPGAQHAALDGSVADTPYPGYTLFAPMASTTTYLVDANGDEVHSWPSSFRPGLSVYLLDDGSILRTENALAPGDTNRFDSGGAAGRIERIGWDGGSEWSFDLLTDGARTHHDVAPMPNGHVLAIAWEAMTESDALAAGRSASRVDATGLWPETLLEIAPTAASGGTIVWEWHARDHLGSGSSRIAIDAGANGPDFLHLNSVDYDAELDQILVSSHGFGEVWVIDHSTTTAEAATNAGGHAGRGGDLLYRWGNPASYGAGTAADLAFYGQHDAEWIRMDDGSRHVTVFNNGLRRPAGNYSSVDEIALPLMSDGTYATEGATYGPDALAYSYVAPDPTSFFAQNISGAQRLPNANTLICAGTTGVIFEITPAGSIVSTYTMPAFGSTSAASLVFRATRYGLDHPAFQGRTLTPTGPVAP